MLYLNYVIIILKRLLKTFKKIEIDIFE